METFCFNASKRCLIKKKIIKIYVAETFLVEFFWAPIFITFFNVTDIMHILTWPPLVLDVWNSQGWDRGNFEEEAGPCYKLRISLLSSAYYHQRALWKKQRWKADSIYVMNRTGSYSYGQQFVFC